jgi:hypothetical protein
MAVYQDRDARIMHARSSTRAWYSRVNAAEAAGVDEFVDAVEKRIESVQKGIETACRSLAASGVEKRHCAAA